MLLPDMAVTKAERKALKKERKRFEAALVKKQSVVRKLITYFIVLAVVFGFGLLIYQQYLPIPESEKSKPVNQVLDSDWFIGSKNAPVVLIEYSDFQCPSCKIYSNLLNQLKSTYGDQIAIVYRHFPLKTIHLQAPLAARTAEAAGKQGKFWEMHDLLFANQSEWAEKRHAKSLFLEYAVKLNLDKNRFKQDFNSQIIKALVEADYRSGIIERINQTPTFFLNGERLQNPQGLEAFKALIDPLLPATSSAEPML